MMIRALGYMSSGDEIRTRYQTGDSLAALYGENVALTADAIQAGYSDERKKWPPVQLRVVSHELSQMLWHTLHGFAFQETRQLIV